MLFCYIYPTKINQLLIYSPEVVDAKTAHIPFDLMN